MYVTVLVTTSRMCRMLERDSLLVWVGEVGPGFGVVGVSEFAARLWPADLGVSTARLDFMAASQSKGDFTEAALSGDRGE